MQDLFAGRELHKKGNNNDQQDHIPDAIGKGIKKETAVFEIQVVCNDAGKIDPCTGDHQCLSFISIGILKIQPIQEQEFERDGKILIDHVLDPVLFVVIKNVCCQFNRTYHSQVQREPFPETIFYLSPVNEAGDAGNQLQQVQYVLHIILQDEAGYL